jgi:hypothetical protein
MTGIPPQLLGPLADAHRKDLEAQAREWRLVRHATRRTRLRDRRTLATVLQTLRFDRWSHTARVTQLVQPTRLSGSGTGHRDVTC